LVTLIVKNCKDATISQVYYLTFMCGSTCFGRLSAHHQERTTALGASGFTVGAWRLERCWSWSGRLCGTPYDDARTFERQIYKCTHFVYYIFIQRFSPTCFDISHTIFREDLTCASPKNTCFYAAVFYGTVAES